MRLVVLVAFIYIKTDNNNDDFLKNLKNTLSHFEFEHVEPTTLVRRVWIRSPYAADPI